MNSKLSSVSALSSAVVFFDSEVFADSVTSLLSVSVLVDPRLLLLFFKLLRSRSRADRLLPFSRSTKLLFKDSSKLALLRLLSGANPSRLRPRLERGRLSDVGFSSSVPSADTSDLAFVCELGDCGSPFSEETVFSLLVTLEVPR